MTADMRWSSASSLLRRLARGPDPIRLFLNILVLLWACSSLSCSGEDGEEPLHSGERWGSIVGRIVFDGAMDDPALKPFLQDIAVQEQMTIQDSLRGVEARVVAEVPNRSLQIDPKTRGIKNALVYLRARPSRVHPSFAEEDSNALVSLAFRDRLFSPRVLFL